MSIGGGPAGAGGNPASNLPAAMAYQPTDQPGADLGFQGLTGGLISALGPSFAGAGGFPTAATYNNFPGQPLLGANPFISTPGGTSYYNLTPFIEGSGSIVDPNNPNLQQAITAGNAAYGGYSPLVAQAAGLTGPESQLMGGANFYNQAMTQGYAPTAFAQSAYNIGNAGTLNAGANAIMGNQSAPTTGQDILNASMYQVGPSTGQATIDANTLTGYGNQILNTGFDPQSALYNQLQNQVSQQAQAANAAAGLGGSAYGASQVGNTLGNFDINWQNQQLARQQAALGAAAPTFTTAQNLVPGTLSAFGQAAGTGENLTASPYELGGAIAGQAANLGNLGVQQGQAGAQGYLAGTQAPFDAAMMALQGMGPAYSQLAQLGGLGYNAQSTGAGNAANLLGQATNIGNQSFVLPQQIQNDLQSYLGLGQSASSLSGQLGALGQQEQIASMAGIGSALGTGSNLLFGSSSPFGSSGLVGALGGLGGGLGSTALGSGAAGATALDAATLAGAGGGAVDLGSLGLTSAGTAAAGGGAGLSALLPAAAAS